MILRAFVDAWERADTDQLVALLREDARWAMPPAPLWFYGRASIARLYQLFPIDWQGRAFRMLAAAANRQPAAAAYSAGGPSHVSGRCASTCCGWSTGNAVGDHLFGAELCRGFAFRRAFDRAVNVPISSLGRDPTEFSWRTGSSSIERRARATALLMLKTTRRQHAHDNVEKMAPALRLTALVRAARHPGGGRVQRSTAGAPASGMPRAAFSTFTYDRRGRGDSGDTPPYAVEREIEDLAALIDAAGGSAAVFGDPSGANLALQATGNGGLPITRLALYDPPYIVTAATCRHRQIPRGATRRADRGGSPG